MSGKPPFSHPDAACLGADPNLFFPEQGSPTEQVDKALRVCTECPAECRRACLEHAITYKEPGIWGGTTGRQRRDMVESGVVVRPSRQHPNRRPLGHTKNKVLEELRVMGDEWTSMSTLCDRFEITRQSVFRALQQLRLAGLVEHEYGHYRVTQSAEVT